MLTDEQIFDILDGCADADIMQQHAHLLANSLAYRQNFNELAAIHSDLAAMPLVQPSANFTKKVLDALPAEKPALVFAKKSVKSGKLTYAFFGIMVVVVFILVASVIIYQPVTGEATLKSNLVWEFFNGFISYYFTRIAILLNLIVMLAVFDKKVLRPYFKQRRVTLG